MSIRLRVKKYFTYWRTASADTSRVESTHLWEARTGVRTRSWLLLFFLRKSILKPRRVISSILNSLVFAIVFLLNLFLISAGSSGAVPFGA